MTLALVLIVVVLLHEVQCAPVVQCTAGCEARRAILLELFYATGGPQWLRPWNISALSMCDWGVGFTCAGDDIIAINLRANNLAGYLPESVSRLTNLSELVMTYGNLRGTIPVSYKALSKLHLLDLMANSLGGPIPEEFGSGWPMMNSFSITDNFFNGTLPDTLASWTQLTFLGFGNNSFHGTLPASYGSGWPSARHLQLHKNRLSGTLPKEFQAWSKVEVFGCESNLISGTLPPEYGAWTMLQNFSVQNNSLTGTLPPAYQSWTSLILISVGMNELDGTLPAAYSAWVNASSVTLLRNVFVGSLPSEWGATMKRLVLMAFGDNPHLQGPLPSSWAGMTSLRQLMGTNCSLSGTLPQAWGPALTRLQEVFLDINAITGVLPPSWTGMTSLQTLTLSRNALYGTLPKEWGSLRLSFFLLQDNRHLSGTIPPSWSSLFSALATFPIAVFSICGTGLCSSAGRFPGLMSSQFICMPPGVAPSASSSTKESIIAEFLPIARRQNAYCRTETLSLMPENDSPPNPTSAPTHVQISASQATTAAGVFQWSSLAMTFVPHAPAGAAVSGVQGLLAAQRLRQRCVESLSNEEESSSDAIGQLGTSAWDNPTQLLIHGLRSPYIYAGGAVVGNTLVLLVVVGALHGTKRALQSWLRRPGKDTVKSSVGSGELFEASSQVAQFFYRWARSFGESDGLPGAAAAPYAVLLQPSIMCSFALLTSPMLPNAIHEEGGSIGTAILGALGLILWCSPMVWWLWCLCGRFRPFPMRSIPRMMSKVTSSPKQRSSGPMSPFRVLLKTFVEPQELWQCKSDPRGGGSASRTQRALCANLMRGYGSLFVQYRHRRQWFLLAELGVPMILGIVAGVVTSLPTASACVGADVCAWLMVAVCGAFVAAHVLLRPSSSQLDHVVSISNGLLVVAAQLCEALHAEDAAMGVGVAASVQGTAVSCIIAFVTTGLQWERRQAALHDEQGTSDLKGGSSGTSLLNMDDFPTVTRKKSDLLLLSQHGIHATHAAAAGGAPPRLRRVVASNTLDVLANLVELACRRNKT